MNRDIVDWLTQHLLPFEGELRARLRRVCASPSDIDDVVQEIYCKVIQMNTIEHIAEPRAFFIRMGKNIVIDRFRRDAVVSIEAVANLEDLSVADDRPGPDRIAAGRTELKWVMDLIAALPDRCREVFRARRVHGLSQRETAQSLGITEKAVEYELTKGMELIAGMVTRHGVSENVVKNRKPKLIQASKDNVSDR